MSANSPSLKNPILIGMIVVCGIAVTILNINTFGPGGNKPSRRMQSGMLNQPALPPDLAIMVQEAMSKVEPGQLSPTSRRQKAPSLDRDPFRTWTPPVVARKTTKAKPTAVKQGPLTCSAIMTGGKRSSALINDKFYSPGDQVQGYTLAWIATNGVTLQNSQGVNKFLPLTIKSGQSGALRVDMGPKSSTDDK